MLAAFGRDGLLPLHLLCRNVTFCSFKFCGLRSGDEKRRVRRWPFPRAAIAIPACGVFLLVVVTWQSSQCNLGIEDVCVLFVVADLAVAKHDVAAAVLCYLGVVRDEDDGAT